MRYYDIYPPLVEMDTDFSVEASKEITLEVFEAFRRRIQCAFKDCSGFKLGTRLPTAR